MEGGILFERMGLVFGIIFLGVLLFRRGVVKERETKVLAELIISVATPALMFHSVIDSYDSQMLRDFAVVLAASVAMPVVIGAVALVVVRWSGVDPQRRGIFTAAAMFPNTIFIGLPMIVSLYGPAAIGLIMAFDFGMTLIFWTLGILALGNFSGLTKAQVLALLGNPPFAAFAAALLLSVFRISPPAVVMDMAETLGQVAIPLSLLLIGMTLASLNVSQQRQSGGLPLLLAVRLLLSPLLMLGAVVVLRLPVLVQQVLVIQAGLPTMMAVAIAAEKYGHDHRFATGAVAATTVGSLLTIPALALLLARVL